MSTEPALPSPDPFTIALPELCLVLLVGPAGVGKSTFARKHFKPTEVLSSDFFRGLVCDDEGNQGASKDAFAALHFLTDRRLAWGKFTVIDATNLQADARKPLLELAKKHHVQPAAIVFNLTAEVCQQRNQQRQDRVVPEGVIQQHWDRLQAIPAALEQERIKKVFVLDTPEKMDAVQLVRFPLRVNRRHEVGPFDLIGDVHGCFDELLLLLQHLGYNVSAEPDPATGCGWHVQHPEGRRLIFVGDLVDRGPRIVDVLRLVMDAVNDGVAFSVSGNHDDKLLRRLRGSNVRLTHGLAETMRQLEAERPEFTERVRQFLERLSSHSVFDHGKLVVAHAGLKKEMHGRVSGTTHNFALYGDTTGEMDADGLPVRRDWALEYDGRATVVYGHTPVQEAEWLNRTINIDTGCVFGGKLTAVRYPEKEIVSVPAARVYCEHSRPFLPPRSRPPAEQMPETRESGPVQDQAGGGGL